MVRYFLIAIVFLSPLIALAENYVPLVDLPGLTLSNTQQDIGLYVNALYLLAISIAAFLAVLKIVQGGVKYTMSDVVTDKGDAKKDIRGALLGLLIVLAAVLVLRTINPSLVDMDALRNATIVVTGSGNGSFKLSDGLIQGSNDLVATSVTDTPINLTNTNTNDQTNYITVCQSQGRQYVITTDSNGNKTGTCNPHNNNLDPLVSSDPTAITAMMQDCNDDNRTYQLSRLPSGETLVTCGIVCQSGLDTSTNKCKYATGEFQIPDDAVNKYNFQCGTDISCASHCSRWAGTIQNQNGPDYGLCSGAVINYQP